MPIPKVDAFGTLVLQGIVIPDEKVAEGVLIKSTSAVWREIARMAAADPSLLQQLSPIQFEELIAGAFEREGYSVVLTPRSGDFGRDLIATSKGLGAIKVLGSVKRYAPGNLVTAEQCRSLIGVLSTDLSASKGIVTTTSDFAPGVWNDPGIKPLLPTRLDLMNGSMVQAWLADLANQ